MKPTLTYCFLNLKGIFFSLIILFTTAITAQTYTPFQPMGVGGGGAMYEPVISPHNSNVMWLSCDMGGMYRTIDGGDSWELIPMDKIASIVRGEVQFTSDPNILYCASRATELINNQLNRGVLSKSIDGGDNWFRVSEPSIGAGINACFADPNDTDRVIINDWQNMYFSDDGGSTWTNVYQPQSPNEMWIGGAYWDGNDIYLGSNEGLLVSHDNGLSFQLEAISGMPAGHGIYRLEGAKENGQIRLVTLSIQTNLLLAHYFVDQVFNDIGDIYRLDYGLDTQWQNIKSNISYSEPINDISMSCCDIDNIWLSVSNNFGAIWPLTMRSTDGGNSWTQMMQYVNNANMATGWTGHDGPRGFAWNQHNYGVEVNPNDPDHVLVLCNYGHVSPDGGNTWSAIYVDPATKNPLGQPSYTVEYFTSSGLDVTSVNDIHFFDSDRYLVGNTDISNMYTEDGGNSWSWKRNIFFSWSNQYGPYAHSHWHKFAEDKSQNILYASTGVFGDVYGGSLLTDAFDSWDGMIFRSYDEGINWDTLATLPGAVVRVTVDQNAPNNIYASVMSFTAGGFYHSADAGLNWTLLTAPPRTEGHPFDIHILDDGALVATYSGRKVNFNLTPSSGVFYSTDGGQTWEDRSDAGMFYYTREITIDQNDSNQNTWYVSVVGRHETWEPSDPASLGKGGVYKTTDRGLNWTKIFNEENTQATAINPLNQNEMYVAVKWDGLYKTTNLNDNNPVFSRVDEFPHGRCRKIMFNPFKPEEMFVLTRGGGLWKRNEIINTAADVEVTPTCVEIFPNPTPNRFTIKGSLVDYDVSILDVSGNVYQSYSPSNSTFIIDLENLPTGLYFVQIKHKTNAQLHIEKILKQ